MSLFATASQSKGKAVWKLQMSDGSKTLNRRTPFKRILSQNKPVPCKQMEFTEPNVKYYDNSISTANEWKIKHFKTEIAIQ
jgi:hypothetical protein